MQTLRPPSEVKTTESAPGSRGQVPVHRATERQALTIGLLRSGQYCSLTSAVETTDINRVDK